MPDVPYTVRVRVGTAAAYNEWNVVQGAPAAYGPVDGLEILETVADTELWPATDAPVECRFQIIAAEFDDVPHVKLGAVVHVEVKLSGVVVADFKGRVAECTAAPHALGVLFSLACLDFKADLRELTVGEVAAPAESHYARMIRWVTECGYDAPPALDPYSSFSFGPPLVSITYDVVVEYTITAYDGKSPGNALDMLQAMLAEWPMKYAGYVGGTPSIDGSFLGYARPQLVPMGTADLAEPTSWMVRPRFDNPAFYGPLKLALVAGKWTLGLVPQAPGDRYVVTVDGGAVDFGGQYSETKGSGTTRVRAQNTDNTVAAVADIGVRPKVTARLEGVRSNSQAHLAALATLYCPSQVPVVRWLADTFTYRTELDLPGWALVEDRPQSVLTQPVALGSVVTVGPIEPAKSPANRAWYSGQLASKRLVIAGKRPTIEFQLRRPDYSDAAAVDAASWTSPFTSSAAAATWANIDPTATWDDFRLARWRN